MIVLAILLTGAAVHFALPRLEIDLSIDRTISEDLPFRRNEIAIRGAFPQTRDVLSIVVESDNAETADEAAASLAARLEQIPERFRTVFYPEGSAFIRRNGLLYLSIGKLEEIGDLLAGAKPLLIPLAADPTLRGLTDVLRLAIDQSDEKAAAALAPALHKMAAAVRNLEEGRDARLSWRSLLDGGDTADGTTTTRKVVLVQPIADRGSLEPVAAAVDAVYEGANTLGLDETGGVEVHVTGDALMHQEELQTVQKGMGAAASISLGLVVLLLGFGLRSLRLVAATLFTLFVGLSWTAAVAVATVGALDIVAVGLAALLVGLSVNFSIQLALGYRDALAAADHRKALEQAGAGMGRALMISAAAVAVGVVSFLPTDYRGAPEVALVAGAGVVFVLFLNLTLLPALLGVMPMRTTRAARWATTKRPTWYQALVRRYAPGIVVVAGVLGLSAATIAPYAWFDDDPLNMRDPNSATAQTLLELLDDPRTKPYAAELLAADAGAAERFAEKFESLPQVEDAVTVGDLIPSGQEEKRAAIGEMALTLSPLLSAPRTSPSLSDAERSLAFEELRALLTRARGGLAAHARTLSAVLDRMPRTPASLIELERALLGRFPPFRDRLAAMLAPQPVTLGAVPGELRNRRLAPDGRALVVVHPKQNLRDPAARREFVDAVRSVSPETSGPPVRFTAVGEIAVGALRQAALTAGLLIVLLLALVLRRVLDVALVLAPLVLGAVMTVAMAVLFKLPFNLANVVVLPPILGLGLAFAIQIVMRHRGNAGEGVMDTSAPRAVAFSAFTTIGAFAGLMLSDHPGTAGMGLLLVLSMGLVIPCMLLVLPALLEIAARTEARKPASSG